jgi:hypothetical protein
MSGLLTQLAECGYTLQHEGNLNFRIKGYGGLIVKDHYWCQHSTGLSGNSDTLWTVLGKHLPRTISRPSNPWPSSQKRSELGRDLLECSLNVIEYLCVKRKLEYSLVRSLISSGQLKQDQYDRACFIGRDESGQIRCITRRATHPTQRIEKCEAAGSDKAYTFLMRSHHQRVAVIITESPIDACSVAVMENRKHQAGYELTHKIATCGSPQPSLLARIRELEPRRVWLYYDNDEAGREMDKVTREMIGSEFAVNSIPYAFGKDPNDVLRGIRRPEDNL